MVCFKEKFAKKKLLQEGHLMSSSVNCVHL